MGGVMAEVSRALCDMRGDEGFLDGILKCCRIVENRAKWEQARGGGIRIIILVR